MQPNVYKFYVDGVEVFPHFNTLTKKYSKESNQMFFRETLDGEIKLLGSDYFLVKNSSIYTEHTFSVRKRVGESFVDYFEGTFNKTDCEIDTDKRVCKLKLSPKDMYSDVMNNYDNEYNLVDLSPKLTSVSISKKPILQVYVLEDNVINNFLPSGATWETEVDSSISLTELYEQGHFDLDSRQIEVVINTGGEYDGVYAGEGWSAAILTSPTNPNYVIIGSISLVGDRYEYGFGLFKANDLTTPLYSVLDYSNSRYATVTFLGASAATSGKRLIAETSMETVLFRVLSGFSVTRDGRVAVGEIKEGDFGYLDNYGYIFSAYTMASIIVSPATSQAPTPYGKSDNGYYFSMPYTATGRYYAFGRSTWGNSSRWIYLNEAFTNTFNLYGSVDREIKDCIHISDVIKVLLNKFAPGISHEATPEYSQFLYGTTNPIYGEHFDIFISQKTHIKKFIYDTPATKVPITFEKVMNMLAKCFCCYWYIEEGKFKIEHIYYFEHGKSYDASNQEVGIDATATYDNKNGRPIGYGQNSVKYDKNSLPSRYEFKYMDESSIEFEGAAVKLKAAYLQQDKTESVTPEDFSADLDMIISNTIAISDDGFALIAAKHLNVEGTTRYYTFDYGIELISEIGSTYTAMLQNGVLSWLYLFNFYCTNLPATVAEYDGYPKKNISVTGVAKCMNQTIKIPLENDPDLYKLVKTDIGNGIISNVEYNINTNQATIELNYEPE